MTLEVARLLSESGDTPLRTVRFMGYGAEEQLSEGSRRYVEAHTDEVDRTRLCVQLDSVGSIAGRNEARVVGPPELTEEVRALVGLGSDTGGESVEQAPSPAGSCVPYTASVLEEVSPFSDMFAFNVRGVPSVWLYRVNMAGMRYFHHSAVDDLPVVSAEEIARCATATARLTHGAAFAEPAYARAIPSDLSHTIREHADRYFGS